jgi:hypothetical protein
MVPGLLVVLLATVLLCAWARHLRKQRGLAWLGVIPWVLGLGFIDAVVGFAWGMARAFDVVAHANPAEKATLLAQGISWAMNAIAIQVVVMLAAAILLSVIALRPTWTAR